MAERISVLINNRDNAQYLRVCLDSVLAQVRPPDEVIVYDDGSEDDSRAVLQEYGSALRVIQGARAKGTPMQNQARAIERAFTASTGELVFLLDADDAFGPWHIAAYADAFAGSERVVMVQAPLWKIDAEGAPLGLEYDMRRHARDYLRHIYATHEVNIYYPTSALAFRRHYLEKRLPLDEFEGQQLWPDARLALVAPHFGDVVTLAEPHTFWRRHARSHTVVKKTSVYDQVVLNRRYYNAFCLQRGLPRVHGWRSPQHIKRWLRHVCPPLLLRLYQRVVPPDTASARRQIAAGNKT